MLKKQKKTLLKLEIASTNRLFLQGDVQKLQESLSTLFKALNTSSQVTWSLSASPVSQAMTGNHNLTLRRSPHGNKTHRDSFVPSQWRRMVHVKFSGVKSHQVDRILDVVRTQTLGTLVDRELVS